jgi:hypothetical protein
MTGGFPVKKLNASRHEGQCSLRVTRYGGKGFEVIETESGPLASRSGLILERAGEGRCEERTMLAAMATTRT